MKYLIVIAVALLSSFAYANDAQKIALAKKIVADSFNVRPTYENFVEQFGTPNLKKLQKLAYQKADKYPDKWGDLWADPPYPDCALSESMFLFFGGLDIGDQKIANFKAIVLPNNKVNVSYNLSDNGGFFNGLVQFTIVNQNGKYLIDDVRSGYSESRKQAPKLDESYRQALNNIISFKCLNLMQTEHKSTKSTPYLKWWV